MITGAILTAVEVSEIRRRLKTIGERTSDKRILEQCRLMVLLVNKSERRVKKAGVI